MLSPRQRETFNRDGLLTLESLISSTAVNAMRSRFWEYLSSRHGLDPDRVDTWTVDRPRNLQPLKRSGVFNLMATREVSEALDDLLGAGGWRPPATWGLPLVTFAVPGVSWTVPSVGWHVDSYGPEHELPGATVFVFLSPVAEHGGGTIVLSGSHRLFNQHIGATGVHRPAEVKAALAARNPWLSNLWFANRQIPPITIGQHGTLDGVHLELRELTGSPGDVVFMHPRTFHAPAPNSLPEPRMMFVEIINR